ncbi:hypothetical protein TRAPUB_7951 [Trametes pubescens]|uniref:Uncharacterized protein n=1 Tax=Trametes pubescens TaxID=154538 RepID=A0A1M2V1Z6_TRAPU|nr:hypothetical protein TRAPUB_7951 [Trametes pubescens]
MATWSVLDVSGSDSNNCRLLPQEAVQDANEALGGDVYFNTTSGLGIILAQALQGQTDELLDRNLPAFVADTVNSTKISVRIQFQDHEPYYNRQVTVLRVLRGTTEAITLGKLAEKIAQETQKYLKGQLALEIGGYHFSFEEIFLWRLRRATRGSWQPEFYVRVSGQA